MGGIAVTVWEESSVVDVVDTSVGVNERVALVISRVSGDGDISVRHISAGVAARTAESIEATLAQVLQGTRATLRVSTSGVLIGGLTTQAIATSIFATVARIRIAILVVVETTFKNSHASRLERALTSVKSSIATFARDGAQLVGGNANVVLLGEQQVLRPARAIVASNGISISGLGVTLSNLTTVSPVTIDILAESNVAGDGTLVLGGVTNDLSASRLRESKVTGSAVTILDGHSTGQVLVAVDTVTVFVINLGLATVSGITIAILVTILASELALTVGIITILTTTAVRLEFRSILDVRSSLQQSATERSSVAESSLTGSRSPSNGTITINASGNLDFTTISRIAVAVIITILTFVVALTSSSTTARAVDWEVNDTSVGEVVFDTFIVEGIDTLSLSRLSGSGGGDSSLTSTSTSSHEDVSPGTLSIVRMSSRSTDSLTVATGSTDNLMNVERRSVEHRGVARSITLSVVRTHLTAIEVTEGVTLSNLTTVHP